MSDKINTELKLEKFESDELMELPVKELRAIAAGLDIKYKGAKETMVRAILEARGADADDIVITELSAKDKANIARVNRTMCARYGTNWND